MAFFDDDRDHEGTRDRSGSASSSGGSGVSKMVGPLPLWGWVIVAIGAWYLYKRFTASSASTSTTAATPTAAPQTGVGAGASSWYPPGGGSGISRGTGGGSSGATVTSPGSVGSAVPSGVLPLTNEVITGAGYSAGPNYQSGVVLGNDGQYYSTSATAASSQSLFSSGTPVFYQPSLGNFVQITDPNTFKQVEAQGTTIWTRLPSQAAAA